MKKIVVLSCLLLIALTSFCQQNSVNARYEKLMRKSHQKQTAGFIFLGAGAAVAGGGIYMIIDGNRRHNNYINNGGYGDYLSDGNGEMIVGVFTTILGTGAMCGSIPFFVGAHRAKQRAMSLSLKSERSSFLYKTSVSNQYYPALALHIPLGR
ncbi:MAG: hypothetical protein QM726_00065 [Chitinophagaceae bacterium]